MGTSTGAVETRKKVRCFTNVGMKILLAGSGKGQGMAGAASVSDGVWMYQLTDKGLAAEITAKGTKYYKDDDLN